MSPHKYACPYCGQHMEFTDEYFGRRIPCPKCQHTIALPALPTGKMTSPLRLVRAAAQSPGKFQFNFASLVLFLREFKHWKIVGLCLLPFALVAGALVAASRTGQPDPPPQPPPLPAAVAPQSLDKLTELTRADQLVQEQLAAVHRAFTASQTAEKNQAALQSPRHGPASPGPPSPRTWPSSARVKTAPMPERNSTPPLPNTKSSAAPLITGSNCLKSSPFPFPALDSPGMALKFFNTLSRSVQEFVPRDPGGQIRRPLLLRPHRA